MNDSRDYRPRRNDWGKRLGLWSAVALVLPVLGAGLLRSVEIWKAPDRIEALAKQQAEMDKQLAAQQAAQKEMRAGLNRILSAMHLEPIKETKEKDNQP
jgi:hypothetical protein